MSKIFGIGLPKSGSKSMGKAMSILGYNSVHYRWNNRLLEQYVEKEDFDFFDRAGFDFYIDCRQLYMASPESLLSERPNDRFIFTYRNPEEQALSYVKHKINAQRNKTYYNGLFYPDLTYKKYLELIHAKIEVFFEKTVEYPDKFLLYELGFGWNPLCKFLNKDIPQIGYPWIR